MRISNPLQPLLALVLFSFVSSAWSQAAEKFTLLSTIRPLSLLATDLVDGLPVEVNTLLPANSDPHNWAMRVSDRQRLETADLVVWLGPDFENFLVKPLRNLKPEKQLELGALASLQWPQKHAHEDDHHDHHGHHHGRDMHLWLNPANALEIQKALAARLAEKRPDWRAVLQERLQQQATELNTLQADIQRRLSPHRKNGFIAYHDTYEHFVSAFGLRQLDAVNQFAEQRLSARTLQRLQDHARGARCLMVEKNDAQEQRLAKTLSLPVVVADGLALDPELTSFASFLEHIAAAFETCISVEPE